MKESVSNYMKNTMNAQSPSTTIICAGEGEKTTQATVSGFSGNNSKQVGFTSDINMAYGNN